MPPVYSRPPSTIQNMPCHVRARSKGCITNTPSQTIPTYTTTDAMAKRPVAKLLNRIPMMARPHTMANRSHPNCPRSEGSIGSGDQKINRRMINDLQNVTRAGANERVIQSRADIDQHQCAAKDQATGNRSEEHTSE